MRSYSGAVMHTCVSSCLWILCDQIRLCLCLWLHHLPAPKCLKDRFAYTILQALQLNFDKGWNSNLLLSPSHIILSPEQTSPEADLRMLGLHMIWRMRFTTKWRAAFRVKSFKVAVIRWKWLGGEGEGGGGDGRRLEVAGGRATLQH